MKRRAFYLKAALAALLVAALGAGAAVVALKVFFPEPRVRAWFIDAARRQLGRDVVLERIDVGLRGLALRGLEVSERRGFKEGTFLRVEDFRLRPSWRALLRGRLVVAAVAADGLKLTVIQDAAGHFNYETLASTSTPSPAPRATSPAPKAGEAPPPELDVRRALVSRGAVEYTDASGASWTLTGLDLDVSDFGQAEPFGVKTSFHVQGAAGTRKVDAKVDFDGRIDLARGSREKFKAEVKRLSVEQQGLRLAASGTAARLDAPELAFDATLSGEGRELLQASGTAKLGGAASADVKWKSRALDTSWMAKLAAQSGVPALNLPAAEGSFSGTFSGGAADVKAFRAEWKDGKVEGSGSASEGRAAFGFEAPEIRPGQYPFLNLPPKLTLPAARLDGELSWKGKDLRIASLKAKVKAGTLSATGSVRAFSSAKPVPDLAVALALDVPSFKLSELPFAVPGAPASFAVPAGRLEGTVRASGEDAALSKLSFKAKGVLLTVDGTLARALAGAPSPDLAVTADLNLPALTEKDLPFAWTPPGLRMPPSHWTADAAYSPRLLRVKALRVLTGRNDVEASGTVADPSGRAAYDLVFKCRSFALEELTQLTPRTRDLKLAGTGFFALSVTGSGDKPVYAGKLQFKDLGATVEGLPLSAFTGTASLDPHRVDVPNLAGRLGDGLLKMDLTVKEYASAPEIALEASLDRFDLGAFLAAKTKLASEREAAQASKAAKTAKAPPAEKPAAAGKPGVVSTRGHLLVGTLIHPNATVTDVKVGWELRGLGGDLRALNGDAKLHVGGGRVRSAGDMAASSKLVKVLLFPLLIVQKIGRVGGLRVFPDFNDMALNQIVGDYLFHDGTMTLRQSEMDSDAAHVSAQGTIDLPAEALNLVVTAQVGRVAPIDVAVTGTFDNPKSKVNIGKFLVDPANKLIQGLLGR